jgi:predicted aldo/keto reductase-like oxidoreductase
MARAHELGMAIVAMKVMGLNMLGRGSIAVVPDYDAEARKRVPATAIRWILQDERISMLNIGISVPEDIDENLATLTGDTTFTSEDSLLLAGYSAKVYESDYVKAMEIA